MCAYEKAVRPMTTGPLNPANGWKSTSQVLIRIRRDSFVPGIKLLQRHYRLLLTRIIGIIDACTTADIFIGCGLVMFYKWSPSGLLQR